MIFLDGVTFGAVAFLVLLGILLTAGAVMILGFLGLFLSGSDEGSH
ncbi:MAG: hypothetical protein P8Y64_05580 [Gammaproteobacteria bacterium]|jgi:hypothetical protein